MKQKNRRKNGYVGAYIVTQELKMALFGEMDKDLYHINPPHFEKYKSCNNIKIDKHGGCLTEIKKG